ncbi:MAG: serine/threonine-protein kinase [Microcoleaceae cyanobacterium]
MKVYCTRPGCPRPENHASDLDNEKTRREVQQKFCTTCGMPLILDSRYLPEQLLGKGGFGTALLACDRRSPSLRKCVVKQFMPPSDLTPAQLAKAQALFDREAKELDRLGHAHPQIPNLLAYFPLAVPGWHSAQTQQFFYIVQQYIEGQNLEDELAAKGRFTEAEVRDVLEQTLPILQFVHESNAIHRDIKPSNLIRHHKTGTLYLLDFGAVKKVTQGAGGAGRSTGIYTPGYAPPEQMQGRSVFPASDLYALAVSCIMLLTGVEPNQLFDSFSNSWQWTNKAQVSDELTAILNRMLSPTPRDRFGSATEVLEALNSGLVVPPSQSSQSSPTSLPSSPSQSSPTSLPSSPSQSSPTSLPSSPSPQQLISRRRRFSTIELLGGAAFTGFEAGLLGMGLSVVLNSVPVVGVTTAIILVGLMLAQFRRWIEKTDLIIIAGISLGLGLWLIPGLQLMTPIFIALGSIAVTALFRLIYLILYRLF